MTVADIKGLADDLNVKLDFEPTKDMDLDYLYCLVMVAAINRSLDSKPKKSR